MKSVSPGFKKEVVTPGKRQKAVVTLGGAELSIDSLSFSTDGNLFKSIMRSCEFDSFDSGIISGQTINAKWGLEVSDQYELIDFGDFVVKETNDDRTTDMYSSLCYDFMIYFMQDYQDLPIEYPCTLKEYLQALCEACGVLLANESFFHDDLSVPMDYFSGLGITYRDILDQIAEVTCSTIFIKEGKLYLSELNDTNEILDPSLMKSVTIKDEFKPLNSFVLARSPQIGDDVYRPITKPEDLSELAFTNNQFLDKRRDEVIDRMFAKLEGLTFWTFDCEELGAGYFDPCDLVTVVDLQENIFKCLIINTNFKINDGAQESLSSTIPEQSTTRYKYATTIEKNLRQTEIIVNKQENTITSITMEQSGLNQRLSQLIQDVTGLENTVSSTGGNNLGWNMIGAFGNAYWYNLVDNTPLAQIPLSGNIEVRQISGQNSCWLIQDYACYQDIFVKNGTYTVSLLFRKLITNAIVSITVNNEIFELSEQNFDHTFSVSDNNIRIILSGDTKNCAWVMNLMCNPGDVPMPYSHNANETITDTVKIGQGITVTSSDMNTEWHANASGTYVSDKNTKKIITSFSSEGIDTKNIDSDKAKIAKVLIQDMGDQTWFTRVD